MSADLQTISSQAQTTEPTAGGAPSSPSLALYSNPSAFSSPRFGGGLAWPACTQDAETANTKHAPIPDEWTPWRAKGWRR